MKILMVNRYDYPEYGCENYFLDLCRLLKEKGHKVIVFTTEDERNIDKEYADYFIDGIDVDHLDSIPLLDKILYAPRTIYSFEAKRKIGGLITDTKPDIVHIHNIKRLISPSILHTIKKFDLPVVYTIHDYHLICHNYRLFSNGKICEFCKGHRYYHAILKKCVRNSFSISLLACVEQYAHRMINIFENSVDMFIAPSNFLQQKMVEYGMSPKKIICVPNFVFTDDYQENYESSNCIVYFGRLIEEKGLTTLIKAVQQIPEITLLIIGDGNYKETLKKIMHNEKICNVEFKDYVEKEYIKELIKRTLCTIVPSVWYDVSPMVIYESFSMGKPVIGAAIGGIPELIDNNINGFLFNPGDVKDLVEKIKYLCENKKEAWRMGRNGRRKMLDQYSADAHYQKIIAIYQNLLGKHSNGQKNRNS